ncbi:hypothetical protein MASR2M17_00570 [Aminivibrio sp.]
MTLLLTMVACILLGAGLPTTANFIVTSTMAAPALFMLGVPNRRAYPLRLLRHYCGGSEPPVALAAYAGAGIAGAEPMKTGATAIKLALAGFIVPFIYVYNPILVLVNYSLVPFVTAVFTAMLGVLLLGMCTVGFYKRRLEWWKRVIALSGALFLLIPGWKSDLFGFVVLAAIYFLQNRRTDKDFLPKV